MRKVATCHGGATEVSVVAYPSEVTDCNCSLCRGYGVLWAYYPAHVLEAARIRRRDGAHTGNLLD